MEKIRYKNLEILSSLITDEAFQDLERSIETLHQQRDLMEKMLRNAPQNTLQEKALEDIHGLLKQVNGILTAVDRLN